MIQMLAIQHDMFAEKMKNGDEVEKGKSTANRIGCLVYITTTMTH